MISVIVPFSYSERYLRDCLLSILAQSLRDIEIICDNDGSSDPSVKIVHELMHEDGRIKLFSQQKSGGGLLPAILA